MRLIPKRTQVLILLVSLTTLLGYNFIRAYDESTWFPPDGPPTTSNVAAPINIGLSTQEKKGDLAVDQLVAFTDVRSGKYCDLLGENCVTDLTIDTLPGKNLLATMRNAGYSVPLPPRNAAIAEWPNEIMCEGYDDDGSMVVFAMRAHAVWLDAGTANYQKVRYRDSSGSRYYTFYPDGNNSARGGVVANCSSQSLGNTLKDICNARLCVF